MFFLKKRELWKTPVCRAKCLHILRSELIQAAPWSFTLCQCRWRSSDGCRAIFFSRSHRSDRLHTFAWCGKKPESAERTLFD
ncbi:hypothetical protein [Burkholderia ubonensis]|uniref:hypothetical protein n=1 Tax=Burkholderia ubonensis TaxID=101571 RepID=UPI0018DFEF8C|nr:hypothetical protein [Burkholderia ubonensis]